MQAKVLSVNEILNKIQSYKEEYFSNYLAMYSSWYGGIVKDPSLMLVPIDDHMVHRGDGIFEAIKMTNRGIYLLDEHLDRLFYSGRQIGLTPPVSEKDLHRIIIQTAEASGAEEGIIRVFVGRGVGSFSPNPYDPKHSELYIVVTKLTAPSAKKYKDGVTLCRSKVPMKPGFFPQVKSLNYLPNVLMKKEAIDRGFDFAVGVDGEGFLLEGSTENLIVLTEKDELIHPPVDKILKGTMMERLFQLIEKENRELKIKRNVRISESDLLKSRGAFLIGTSLDVIPISKYEDHGIRVPKAAKHLLAILHEDQQKKSGKLTVF